MPGQTGAKQLEKKVFSLPFALLPGSGFLATQ
jgi:hypothetical protein